MLKDKGFDEHGCKYWNKSYLNSQPPRLSMFRNEHINTVKAPEQWMVVEWLRVKHNINVEANYLPNIFKYRWVAKPMNIIPNSFKTAIEYVAIADRYYGKENFDSPQKAYSAAIDHVLNNLI